MTSSNLFQPFHVVPFNDLRPHLDSKKCWCRPKEVEPDLWVHNSLDGREHTHERGLTH